MNFKSLKEFKTQNPDFNKLSEQELILTKGGSVFNPATYECENRATSDNWNCGDSQSRVKPDGRGWTEWILTKQEVSEGVWEDRYTMLC